MDKNELIECIELLCKQVSDNSSESDKITILEDIKPSSFGWIMNCIFEYLEMH